MQSPISSSIATPRSAHQVSPDSDIGYALDLEARQRKLIDHGHDRHGQHVSFSRPGYRRSESQWQPVLRLVRPGCDTGAPLATFGTVSSGMDILKELKEGDVVESIKISEK